MVADKDLFGSDVAPRKIKKNEVKEKRPAIRLDYERAESKPFFMEVLKLSPHYSVTYGQEITGFFHRTKVKMPSVNRPLVGMSDRARRRLGSAMNWMILFSTDKRVYSLKEKKGFKFKINFITLTLSDEQRHSDHFIKQHLLAPFLKWMERSHNCQSYIWKAEAQEDGNLHFHITTNQFIHWKSVRAKWNKLLAKHSYCKVFQDGTNDKGNAATQIKSVKTLKGLVSYMQGYITKKDIFKKKHSIMCPYPAREFTKRSFRQAECSDGTIKEYKREIDGKLWSTSQNLSKINCFISQEDGQKYEEAANQLLSKSKILFADQFITVRKHDVLRSKDMHPLFIEKLREVKEKHFSRNLQPSYIEIESFY